MVAMSQVWVLYHMDLQFILVSMVFNLSHGSALYWSASMIRTHFFMIKKYLFIVNAWFFISNQGDSFLEVITFSFKYLSYHIPLASCFGGDSVTLKFCHQHVIGSLTHIFALKSQTWSETYSDQANIFISWRWLVLSKLSFIISL